MTYPTLNSASEIWVIAAGAEKAEAVHLALSGADKLQVPSAGLHGRDGTWWFLDVASAAGLS